MKKHFYFLAIILFSLNTKAQIITTIAGGIGDNNPATQSALTGLASIALDSIGNIYFVDQINHRVRKINASNGIITTVAGSGIQGFAGDGGPALLANLNLPSWVSLDRDENLIIADRSNNRIRKVNIITGIISTIAGNGIQGFSGDSALATSAKLYSPFSAMVDSLGNLFISDIYNARIRKVTYNTRIINTVAGNGTKGFWMDSVAAIDASLLDPACSVFDRFGNMYFSDNGNDRIRKVDRNSGIISTIAGNGVKGYAGDSGQATAAKLSSPVGLVIDPLNNLIFADRDNHRIRKVNLNNGIISTLAGNGIQGYSGDSVAATLTRLNSPACVVLDKLGNLYISDNGNHLIRKVNALTGLITTIAGNRTTNFGGDGFNSINANLNFPLAIAFDLSNNLFLADYNNNRVRKINRLTGIITTVAGGGTGGDNILATASAVSPAGLTFDKEGNLYIADNVNDKIRKVNTSTGVITTIAGNGIQGYSGNGGLALSASLNNPAGITFDTLGNLYIADGGNNVIRKINKNTNIITTVAGTSTNGFIGDGYVATIAWLANPSGIAVDKSGNLYIADKGNNRIRKVTYNTGIITTIAGNGTQGYGGNGGIAISAKLNYPTGISLDLFGNIFIADRGNYVIRKIDKNTNNISTVAGNNISGFGGDGGLATSAYLSFPSNIAFDSMGNFFIADSWNNKIRKVSNDIIGIFNNNISGSSTICSGSNIDSVFGSLPIGGNGIYTYTWLKSTISATQGFLPIGSSNTKNYKPINLTQSTWFRRSVESGIYADTSSAVLVTVNTRPVIGNITGNATPNSLTLPFTYSLSNQSNSTYYWSAINGTIQSGQGTNTVNILWSSIGSGSLTAKITNANNCADSTNLPVNITNNINGIFNNNISGSSTICSGSNIDSVFGSLPIGGNGIYTYTWLKSTISATQGFLPIGSSNAKNYMPLNLTQNTWFRRSVESGIYADTSVAVLVTVHAIPVIGNITGNATPNSLTLPFTYSLSNQSNSTYYWSAINGTIQSGQGTNTINIIWPITGTGSLKAKITNANNCSDSTNLSISITSVGINKLSLDNDLNVYPNPTKNSITITNKTNLVGKKYVITNLVGQILIIGKLNIDETIVNLETIQSGVYLLSIDGLNKQSIKVIKE